MESKKSKQSFKPHNKHYNVGVLKHLYETGLEHLRMRDQWLSMNEYKLASEYAIKAETITELLENVVVFNVGDGLRAFSQPIAKRLTVDERINSFKEILK